MSRKAPAPTPESESTTAPITASDLLDRLFAQFGPDVHGRPRWVAAAEVRNAAGFAASRSADFIAIDTWESGGLETVGAEIKVSRSDLMREIADHDKHEAFARYCHRWFLVVSDRKLLAADVLALIPATWGILVPDSKGGLKSFKGAPKLTPEPWSKSFTAAFVRALSRDMLPKSIIEKQADAKAAAIVEGVDDLRRKSEERRVQIRTLEQEIRQIKLDLGLDGWGSTEELQEVIRLRRALKDAPDKGERWFGQQVERFAKDLEKSAALLREALAGIPERPSGIVEALAEIVATDEEAVSP